MASFIFTFVADFYHRFFVADFFKSKCQYRPLLLKLFSNGRLCPALLTSDAEAEVVHIAAPITGRWDNPIWSVPFGSYTVFPPPLTMLYLRLYFVFLPFPWSFFKSQYPKPGQKKRRSWHRHRLVSIPYYSNNTACPFLFELSRQQYRCQRYAACHSA